MRLVARTGNRSGYPTYGLRERASVASPSGLAHDDHGHLVISSFDRNVVLRFTRASRPKQRDAARARRRVRSSSGSASATAATSATR